MWPSLLSFLYWQMWHLNETPWCTAICFFDKYFFPAYPHCCNHSWCNHIWALHEHFSHAFSCEIDTKLCNHIADNSNHRNSHVLTAIHMTGPPFFLASAWFVICRVWLSASLCQAKVLWRLLDISKILLYLINSDIGHNL